MFMLRKRHLVALSGILAFLVNGTAFAEDNQSKPNEHAQHLSNNEVSQEDILKASEAFGHFIGRNLNSPGIKFDLERMIKGMREGAAGKPAPMSDEEYETLMANLQEKTFNVLAEDNLKSANDFLKKNADAEGVIEIEPGKLQYIILEKGHDPAIAEHGTPMINYTGKYLDGTVFGSSAEVGGPITLSLDQTIPGFSKGVVGMKEGEKRRLFVHPDLGYGKTGQLPPNSLLIFEIEAVKATSPEKDTLSEADDILPDDEDTLDSENPEDLDNLGPLALSDESEDN